MDHVIGRYCNSSEPVPAPISSSGHEVELRFRTDGSQSDTGFLLTWAEEAGCGGLVRGPKVVEAPPPLLQGEIASPLHPETYADNLLCEWIIRLPPDDRVAVR